MGTEGGTSFIPEGALGFQWMSYFLPNAFQLHWLQAWGGQVIHSSTQWNGPAGTWTWGLGRHIFLALVSQALCFLVQPPPCLHHAARKLCLPQPVLRLSPLRTGIRSVLQVKSERSGRACEADCSTPAQSIQCLAKARLKIAKFTCQDSKRKNLAHIFPLHRDFSSPLNPPPFFFFLKRESPCLHIEIQNAQVVSSQLCDPWTSVTWVFLGISSAGSWESSPPTFCRKEFSSEWNCPWARSTRAQGA